MQGKVVLTLRDGSKVVGPARSTMAELMRDTRCNRGGITVWIEWHITQEQEP